MLKQRVVTGVIMAAIVLAAIFYLPSPIFILIAALIVSIGAWEWSRLASYEGVARYLFVFVFAVILVVIFWFSGLASSVLSSSDAELLKDNTLAIVFIASLWWLVALFLVKQYPAASGLWSKQWQQTIIGVLVLLPTWASLVFLRLQEQGQWLIVVLIMCVVCADTGAYFFGRKWGRHKLAASVSPGKSKEGFYGGLFTSIVFAIILIFSLGVEANNWWLLLLIVVASLASVLGDLVESMFKRQRGIKDSGAILPGHGGVLDRLDSLTAAAPIFVLLYILSGWRL
ncbi:phosphatidate cytidylyltransferase [Aurantivibrio infirmus]